MDAPADNGVGQDRRAEDQGYNFKMPFPVENQKPLAKQRVKKLIEKTDKLFD